MYLCLKKNFRFPETISFKYEDASYLLSLSFVLFGHDFPNKASQVSHPGLSQVLFLTFECIVKAKKKKINPSHESAQSLHFSTWPKFEAIFSQIKGCSHEINLLVYGKYDKRFC